MRPSKDQYYLNIAKEVSQRATCIRRRYGAIIVKDDQVISTGYCGAPRSTANCIDSDVCKRAELKIPPGERYELCRGVHAEMNTIINAARVGVSVLNATLYLYGEDLENTGKLNRFPCKLCRRVIINAGLASVIITGEDGPKKYSREDIINIEESD